MTIKHIDIDKIQPKLRQFSGKYSSVPNNFILLITFHVSEQYEENVSIWNVSKQTCFDNLLLFDVTLI